MKYEFIYFDSGGTLFDPNVQQEPTPAQVANGQTKRVHALLQGMDVQTDFKELETTIAKQKKICLERLKEGYQFFHLMQAVIEEMDLPLKEEDAACLADAFAGPRYKEWLFPGTQQALQTLVNKGYRLGVIANTQWPGFCMDRALMGLGILSLLDVRIYSGDIGIRKPDPDIFRLAEQKCGEKGKDILFVGNDLIQDIKGGKDVGWSTAFRKETEVTSEGLADLDFDHISQLVQHCLD